MTQEQKPEYKIFVNELLISAQHAMETGKTTDDILIAFSKFYSDENVLDARKLLATLEVIGKTTGRKIDKSKEILNIIKCLRDVDWLGKNINFAAVDMRRVCYVAAAIGDEIQFRAEIQELKTKFEDLTSALGEVKNLSKTVTSTTNEVMTSLQNFQQATPTTYSSVVRENQEPQHDLAGAPLRRAVSPPISQKMAMKRHQQQLAEPDEGFKTVTYKKKRPKFTMGTRHSDIKAVPKPRIGILFATRCQADVTTIDLEKQIKETTGFSYDLVKVEEWNAKHSSYKSFKLFFELKDHALSKFFKDMEDPSLWPENVWIRPFRMPTGNTYKKIEDTNKSPIKSI